MKMVFAILVLFALSTASIFADEAEVDQAVAETRYKGSSWGHGGGHGGYGGHSNGYSKGGRGRWKREADSAEDDDADSDLMAADESRWSHGGGYGNTGGHSSSHSGHSGGYGGHSGGYGGKGHYRWRRDVEAQEADMEEAETRYKHGGYSGHGHRSSYGHGGYSNGGYGKKGGYGHQLWKRDTAAQEDDMDASESKHGNRGHGGYARHGGYGKQGKSAYGGHRW